MSWATRLLVTGFVLKLLHIDTSLIETKQISSVNKWENIIEPLDEKLGNYSGNGTHIRGNADKMIRHNNEVYAVEEDDIERPSRAASKDTYGRWRSKIIDTQYPGRPTISNTSTKQTTRQYTDSGTRRPINRNYHRHRDADRLIDQQKGTTQRLNHQYRTGSYWKGTNTSRTNIYRTTYHRVDRHRGGYHRGKTPTRGHSPRRGPPLTTGPRYTDDFKKWRGLVHGCGCDHRGSLSSTCDIVTGQCQCHLHVVGRACARCKIGYWGHVLGSGCQKCHCHNTGSVSPQCDDGTGQCRCLQGVRGPSCDDCLPGYWGFSRQGCRACDPCDRPGRFCDLSSGRCVCPTNTEGDRCERCAPGSWDYSTERGCKPCNCSGPGSLGRQCDSRTGQCVCAQGFQDERCTTCISGHFGPNCSPCNCVVAGTNPLHCDRKGRCQCDSTGQCPCKANVFDRSCGKCVGGTFGLSADNPTGCTACYCFRRSTQCTQADLTWSQLWVKPSRRLTVKYRLRSSSQSSSSSNIIIRPWNTKEICYINLALPVGRQVTAEGEETRLNITNQLHVIPGTYGSVTIGTSLPFPAPLYWQLPREFKRDKVLSYNGYLRFRVQSIGGSGRPFPDQILQSYPLVSLQGNWQLVLEYYPPNISADGRYSVKLHEDYWRLKNEHKKLSREKMLIALQNIQHILIRATHSDSFSTATLSQITLDLATEGTPVSSRKALGVEKCICPPSYKGTSCQNPNIGFYRWYKDDYFESTIIIDLVGEARPCNCNGQSETCNSETGICENCRGNMAGEHCQVCATGYYGNARTGRCKPCKCPTRRQNFAETCKADRRAEYVCNCRDGYTGNRCEKCAIGFYGNPRILGGSCEPCGCDPNGSLHPGCNKHGQCTCKPGITGIDCSSCAPRHIISHTGCKSCVDGCVDVLLDEVESMIRRVTSVNVTGYIPAPWDNLNLIKTESVRLREGLSKYKSHVGVSQEMLLGFTLDYDAKELFRKVLKVKEQARVNHPPSDEVKKEAKILLTLLNKHYVTIEEAVAYLEHYAVGETPSISVGGALDEAEKVLTEIKMRNFDKFKLAALSELKKSEALLARMQMMQLDKGLLHEINGRHEELDKKITEMMQRIAVSIQKIEQTRLLNVNINNRMSRTKKDLDEISRIHTIMDDQNFDSRQLIRDSDRNLKRTRSNFADLQNHLMSLRNSSRHLEDIEERLWRLNKEYKDEYVKRANDHAMALTTKSIQLESLFNKTRDVADGPLQAAQAYQRIVGAINSAEEAAKNASEVAQKAYRVAYPGDPDDSLVRRAKLSLQTSGDLSTMGGSLPADVEHLTKDLKKQIVALGNTRSTLDETNNKISDIKFKMDTQLSSRVIKEIEDASEKLGNTQQIIDDTLFTTNLIYKNLTKFRKYASELSDIDTSLFKEIRMKISSVESNTAKGVRLSTNLHKSADRFSGNNKSFRDRIDALKRKIEQTRQYASSIRVSLTTDSNGQCVRKYRRSLQPSTTNKIVMNYALNSNTNNALLLYLGATNGTDLMAVEVVNGRVRFTWNVGGGTQSIVHPLKLQVNDPEVSDDTKWYTITINRIGNIGQLEVRPNNLKDSHVTPRDVEPVSEASPAGYSTMNLHSTDTIWIGGAPDTAKSILRTQRFAGCLHLVVIDGEQLGLWNFTSTEGCGACNEGIQVVARQDAETSYGFNGEGYYKGTNRLFRNNHYYSIVLTFQTLDEYALLFLAAHPDKEQFFTIALINGHVVFTVQFDKQTRLVMKSSKRLVNLRVPTQIQAIVQNKAVAGKRMGRLMVGEQDQLATVNGGLDLNINEEPFYFGGVDPEFDVKRWSEELVLRSILGCMGGFQVLEEGKNPFTDGQFFGIESTCSKKPLNDVGFLGNGYIELPSHVLRRESSFGFTFQTMESDAMLMVSTFLGQPLRGAVEHPPDFYSVSLVEGHLDLRLYAGSISHRLMSKERFNDGRLHAFFVIKENRRVTLHVDDTKLNETRLDRGSQVIVAPDMGGLYFGGAPSRIDIVSMVGSSTPLKGCIRDVIVNNRVISFSEPIQYNDVYIGRCADLPPRAMQGMESDMKEILSCRSPAQHTVELGALKFGDQSESYVLLPISRELFKGNFNITFEFRTYYPNGLFLIASETKRRKKTNREIVQLISAQLQNGRIVISVQGKKKNAKIITDMPGLNTGEWRKIILKKDRKKLRLFIDDNLANTIKIPKKLNVGTKLFLGGLPTSIAKKPTLMTTDPLRGCMRNININNEEYTIPSAKHQERLVGVVQCFANVQPGSYFPGDAYALYSTKFHIGALLEMRLEFRTWELNGVLLSIRDPDSTGAFSLELVNGAAVVTVDMGHSHIFSARVNLKNRFTLCDNEWHTIKVHYIKDSLTLKVDRYPESYGFNGSNNVPTKLADGSLYIGGLPESAPQGTLKTRENFKGCIRNIVLNSERRDWTDMYKIHNVLLNACPVQ